MQVRRAALTFPLQTGLGGDNIAPRAIGRLSDALLLWLCRILLAAEALGTWPAIWHLVLIVLIPKADGGRRPIGLFPTLIRIWMRARNEVARHWEARNALPCFYGGKGMGAQRAAWMSSYRAEAAAKDGMHFTQSLLDLIKAFERLPHHLIVQAARRLGYCLTTLRLSLASYRLPRALGADGAYSRLVRATLGITAGAGFAAVELRILLHEVVTGTLRAWPLVTISLYVDDAALEVQHRSIRVAQAILAGATDQFVNHLQIGLQLGVSTTKSLTIASTPGSARAVAAVCRTRALTAVRSAKLLGVGAAGGRTRITKFLRVRIATFKKRVPRIHQLRKAGVNAIRLTRAAGTPVITYGSDTTGMATTHLQEARRAIAKAVAPVAGGKSAQLVLYAADGAHGSLDPAFDAHTLPLQMWALAHWQKWVPITELSQSMQEALRTHSMHLSSGSGPNWKKVCGPVAALVASMHRIGWSIASHRCFTSDDGETFDFLLDPPCMVVQAARRSVRRWRLHGIAEVFPALVPVQPDLFVRTDRTGTPPAARTEVILDFPEAVDALLSSRSETGKKVFDAWEPKCKGDLRSAISGGQWSQARLAAVRKWTDTSLCQLCHQTVGTLMHRHSCPATRPADGWQQPQPQAAKIRAGLSSDRRQLLTTRGLFVLKASLPCAPAGGTFTWLVPVPSEVDEADLTWYVDGSLYDEGKRVMRRTGFGIAAADSRGTLLACGHGVPPDWVHDAAGAELWAVYFVLSLSLLCDVPFIVTDCKGILDSLQHAPQALTQHDKALARTWSLIRHTLDDDFSIIRGRLRWMPSHTSSGGICKAVDSTGQPITILMWRANRLVDGLAKIAAGRHRLPGWAFKMLGAASQLVKHAAAQLGVVTHRANNHKVSHLTDGGAMVTRICRDSTAESQRPRCSKVKPPPSSASTPASSGPTEQATPAAPAQFATGSNPARGTKRCSPLELTASIAGRRKAHAAMRQQQLRLDLQEQEQVARWVASRDLTASSGPTAQERMERLRQRLRSKQP